MHAGLPISTTRSGATRLDVPRNEGTEHGDFGGLRLTVAGRAPRQNVGDVNRRRRVWRAARKADGGQHAVKQLPSGANKGAPLKVFLAARRFSEYQHPRRRVAIGKDKVTRTAFEFAMLEPSHRRGKFGQILRRRGKRLGLGHRVNLCTGALAGGGAKSATAGAATAVARAGCEIS